MGLSQLLLKPLTMNKDSALNLSEFFMQAGFEL